MKREHCPSGLPSLCSVLRHVRTYLQRPVNLKSATVEKNYLLFVPRRGKGRTQLSMVPRSLHRQSLPVKKVENGTSAAQPPTSASTSASAETKSLSNSDFARMLLNK